MKNPRLAAEALQSSFSGSSCVVASSGDDWRIRYGRVMRVLVVEDDGALRSTLTHALKLSGYAVDAVGDGCSALAALQVSDYALMVLDLGLPDTDGMRLLAQLRERGNRTPVLVLSARDSVDQRVQGLRHGADDYLTKPFALPELEARIAALIRRTGGSASRLIHGALEFDPATRQASAGGTPLELSAREAAILDALMQRAGEAVIKSRLVRKLSDWDSELGVNAIEVYIHRLRRKLEPHGIRIRTLHGLGYLLEKPDAP